MRSACASITSGEELFIARTEPESYAQSNHPANARTMARAQPQKGEITLLLERRREGESSAFEQWMPFLYSHLHEAGGNHSRRNRAQLYTTRRNRLGARQLHIFTPGRYHTPRKDTDSLGHLHPKRHNGLHRADRLHNNYCEAIKRSESMRCWCTSSIQKHHRRGLNREVDLRRFLERM